MSGRMTGLAWRSLRHRATAFTEYMCPTISEGFPTPTRSSPTKPTVTASELAQRL